MSDKKLGFGLMRLPFVNGDIDMEQAKVLVDAFIEKGFTYFDTAWMFSDEKSEYAAREALVSRHPRESFTLAAKLPAYSLKTEEDRERVFNEQLERTGAGYFDYYCLHDVNSISIQTFEKLKCFDFIKEKKAQGLVKHIGFSYHADPELLDEILTEHPELEYVQLQLNYLDWESISVQSRKCYDIATEHGKPVIVMEPVKGGTLAHVPQDVEDMLKQANPDMSIPSWAIRFAASQENVMLVLSGMSSMEQLEDNTSYMQDFVPLTEAEIEMMRDAARMINQRIPIHCVSCSYCTIMCPKSIAIPEYFALYNAEMQEDKSKSWTSQPSYYANLTLNYGKASDCIKCGQCEEMCPQHLPIRKYLAKVAAKFETPEQ